VVAPHQVGDADQGGIGQRVLGQGRDRGLSVDVGQGLGDGSGGQDAGSAVEADLGQVSEQGVGRTPAGRSGPAHGIADPDDQAPVGGSAGQEVGAKARVLTG
jgi:hypothetical protein